MLEKEKQIAELEIQERNKVILFIILGLVVILLFIRFRFVSYKKQQIINRQKLEFQKIVTEQQLLRTQMNPHFIFNSLISIQSFIISEKSHEAEKFLARFAKLMRGILENSREEFVPLDKEIEILQLYLELEKLRFENKFDFDIRIGQEVEPEFIHIPPMLIQPFVENAILHGVQGVDNGQIVVSVKEEDNCIICSIDDNGIGRKKSKEHPVSKKHTSLATKIVQERLKTLSVQLNKAAFYTFEDKYSKDNCPLGTTVTLQIPFKEM